MTTWRAVPGWLRYEASDEGQVRSITRVPRGKPPGLIKPVPMQNGYMMVTLCGDDGRWQVPVHRVVCMAFHGLPPTPQHEVAHGDGTRTNNRPDNLRWVTRRENMQDCERHGRRRLWGHRPRNQAVKGDTSLDESLSG